MSVRTRARKTTRPPEGESWIWMTRSLLESHAWRSLGINARRIIDFLLIEHAANGGAENGRLKAPYSQLENFISKRHVTKALKECVNHGLIRRTDAIEGTTGPLRRTATYRLTWLPTADGAKPTNEWKTWTSEPATVRRAAHIETKQTPPPPKGG